MATSPTPAPRPSPAPKPPALAPGPGSSRNHSSVAWPSSPSPGACRPGGRPVLRLRLSSPADRPGPHGVLEDGRAFRCGRVKGQCGSLVLTGQESAPPRPAFPRGDTGVLCHVTSRPPSQPRQARNLTSSPGQGWPWAHGTATASTMCRISRNSPTAAGPLGGALAPGSSPAEIWECGAGKKGEQHPKGRPQLLPFGGGSALESGPGGQLGTSPCGARPRGDSQLKPHTPCRLVAVTPRATHSPALIGPDATRLQTVGWFGGCKVCPPSLPSPGKSGPPGGRGPSRTPARPTLTVLTTDLDLSTAHRRPTLSRDRRVRP